MKTQHGMWTMLAVIALGTLVSGCGLHGKPRVQRKSRPASPEVATVGTAATEDVTGADVVAPGIVEPWGGQVDLSAREPGWIARVLVKEGDVVRQGQLLASLESDPQRQAVELSRAELAEAMARAGFARVAAARIGRLHADGTAADNDADRAAADAQEQAAAVQRAEARLRLAEVNLARRRIEAPSPGTVLLNRFHRGEFYDPGAGPFLVLGDMTRLQVRLEVDEIDASDVAVGAPCTLVSDGGQALAQGKVARVAPRMGRRGLALESPTARADVRVREVFVEIPATALLVPGQRVWGHTPRADLRRGT